MTKTLFILNDPPYGTERSYNALRLAGALAKREGEEVKVFLMGDAGGLRQEEPESATGLLQRRTDAAKRGTTRRRDWRVRHLHGCEGNYRRRVDRHHTPRFAR